MSSASAKIILFGEHAVVYGQPAIAVPVSALRAYAEVVSTDVEQFQIIARDLNNKAITFDEHEPLLKVVHLTLERLGKTIPDIAIEVRSDIPIASGLGSGAAISTVIVRALADYFVFFLSDEIVNQIVFESEKLHHGTPSGIDNTVIVYEKAVYFVREQAIESIKIATPLKLLIGNTGRTALTKHAVGDVARLYEDKSTNAKQIVNQIGIIAEKARVALENGDAELLGKLMNENHRLLRDLTVSSNELDTLVKVATDAGAYGAKLSGGGRGGNMIALVSDETQAVVEQALLDAGAVSVVSTILEATD
ncbi:MAG: mevalonate kinase [Chloroflexota bacterium]